MREVAAVVSPMTPGAFVTAQCGRDPAKAVPHVRERDFTHQGTTLVEFTRLGPESMQQEHRAGSQQHRTQCRVREISFFLEPIALHA